MNDRSRSPAQQRTRPVFVNFLCTNKNLTVFDCFSSFFEDKYLSLQVLNFQRLTDLFCSFSLSTVSRTGEVNKPIFAYDCLGKGRFLGFSQLPLHGISSNFSMFLLCIIESHPPNFFPNKCGH